jgi:hypothetical protein
MADGKAPSSGRSSAKRAAAGRLRPFVPSHILEGRVAPQEQRLSDERLQVAVRLLGAPLRATGITRT